jgi:hypothetical protein
VSTVFVGKSNGMVRIEHGPDLTLILTARLRRSGRFDPVGAVDISRMQ